MRHLRACGRLVAATCSVVLGLQVANGAAYATSAPTVTATVFVSGGPNGVAVDATTGLVYVSTTTGVAVIDAANDSLVTTITGMSDVAAITVDPSTNTIYAAELTSPGAIAVIDGATNTVTSTVPWSTSISTFPVSLAVDPTTGLLFAGGGNDVVVYNAADPGAGSFTVALPDGEADPNAMAIDLTTGRLYVGSGVATSTGGVSVLNAGATPSNGEQEILANIDTGGDTSAKGIAVDPVTDQVYVASGSHGTLDVIDGSTNAIVTTITGLGSSDPLSLEGQPLAVAVDEATNAVYVTPNLSTGLYYVDGATDTLESSLSTPIYGGSANATGAEGVAVDQSSGAVFVAEYTSNVVEVIGGSGGSSGSAPGTIDVNSGTLSFVSAPGNLAFPAVTLDGVDQSVSASLGIDLGDNTGLGAGWQLDATGTELSDGSHSLPADAVTVDTAPNDACDTGATCTLATDAVSYPYVLPTGTSPPAATALFSAAVGTGMGDQTVTPVFSLAVPANAAAGAYSATWTFSLVSGP